jgi:hypothetical protein
MIVSIAANGQTMRFVGNPIKLDGMVDSPAAPPRLDGGRALVESLIRAG